MVKGTKLMGIIDWERSGYYPRWGEYVGTLTRESESDAEWKALLREYMECDGGGGEEAAKVWKYCYLLRRSTNLSKYQEEALAALYIEAGVKGEGSEKV